MGMVVGVVRINPCQTCVHLRRGDIGSATTHIGHRAPVPIHIKGFKGGFFLKAKLYEVLARLQSMGLLAFGRIDGSNAYFERSRGTRRVAVCGQGIAIGHGNNQTKDERNWHKKEEKRRLKGTRAGANYTVCAYFLANAYFLGTVVKPSTGAALQTYPHSFPQVSPQAVGISELAQMPERGCRAGDNPI